MEWAYTRAEERTLPRRLQSRLVRLSPTEAPHPI